MDTQISDEILRHSLFAFLILGSVAGLLAGIALLWKPDGLLRLNTSLNRWISTRKWTRIFAHTIALDAWFYRYNRLCGTLLLAGSVYVVYFMTDIFDKAYVLKNVFNIASIPAELTDGLLDGFVLITLTGTVFVALISLFLLFRPSMLREFEFRANRTTSLRKGLKPLEMQHGNLDRYVIKHQRLAGVLILAGSLYTLVILGGYWKAIL